MSETIQLDGAGRMVLPKHLRDRFHLHGGDSLSVEVKGDAIELRPAKAGIRLKRVNGILVVASETRFRSGGDPVEDFREARLDELAGGAKGRR